MNTQTASISQTRHVVPCVANADSGLNRNHPRSLASLGFAALLLASAPALAQVAPNLNTAAPYAVLGTNAFPIIGTVTCTNTGPGSTINGQVGTTFNAITNTLCTITGPIVAPVPVGVVTDFNAAFASVDVLNPVCNVLPFPIVTATLPPGVYCSAAGTTIGAGVILTLNGTASDVWVFRVGTGGPGALTLNSAQVRMGGTGDPCNVYWKTSAAATSTDSIFLGTVLSGNSVTMTRGSWIGGRALATTDVTVTDAAPLTGCAAALAGGAGGGGAGVPTLSEWAMVMLAALLAIAGFAAMRRKAI